MDIKEIFEEVKDTCDEYFETLNIDHDFIYEEMNLNMRVYLGLSKKCLNERKKISNKDYLITSNEIKSIWPSIIWSTEKLEGMGFQVGINYRPNLVDLVLTIIKKY